MSRAPIAIPETEASADELARFYLDVRRTSERLCAPLAIEDYVLQAMPDVSPTRWHLAHVTWFFETFLIRPFLKTYVPLDDRYTYLFNSYYNAVGEQFSRPRRGQLSRPTVAEIRRYREHVDDAVLTLLNSVQREVPPRWAEILVLGANHEQQHQELMLTDIKYNLSINPLRPSYVQTSAPISAEGVSLQWRGFDGGVVEIGYSGNEFAFDNEFPRHAVHLEPFLLASRPVLCGEFLEFIEGGGYHRHDLWLSDGWQAVRDGAWQAPLYWENVDGEWFEFTLSGMRPIDRLAPVCHVSYFEADAYARWVGCRLPSEAEWEHAAAGVDVDGNLLESGLYHPASADAVRRAIGDSLGSGVARFDQMYGDVWEWTQSAYLPYPGYRAPTGALGEYNGKFMINQMVLRGGSCATPRSHIRPTYRNFFHAGDRWQFMGLRLARDA